jgi:glycosyltransferase involved in cell wall biosynthesis
MNIVNLTASPFFGGPERQMLGLARSLPTEYCSMFLSFAERGLSRPFMHELQKYGLATIELRDNAPHLWSAATEVAGCLRSLRADVLLCHGYKPDIIGYVAARKAGVPVVAVSRGWTWATLKVRVYEWLDRRILNRVDHVVCVSHGQAAKVRRAGVGLDKITVIHNSIDIGRFARPDPSGAKALAGLFQNAPSRIAMAVGRLSPEKGFGRLVECAAMLRQWGMDVGFVLVGEGPERESLEHEIARTGLTGRFILAGFRNDVDRLIPHADLLVQSSLTEGMPNVVLEAMAASVPVVATAVGGTPEVVDEGVTGLVVRPGRADELAAGVMAVLADEVNRLRMGHAACERVRRDFTFASQSVAYQALLDRLVGTQRLEGTGAATGAAHSLAG